MIGDEVRCVDCSTFFQRGKRQTRVCPPCQRERDRLRRQAWTPEQRRAALDRSAAWAKKNRDRTRAAGRRYFARNRAECIAARKAWGEANPDRVAAINAASRARRRKSLSDRASAWAKANPDKARVIAQRKRARKRSAAGEHTAADTQAIRAAQRDRCGYCRARLQGAGHLDHIVPLARGGSNYSSNLQWLCQRCNLTKGTRDPIVFAQSIGRLL